MKVQNDNNEEDDELTSGKCHHDVSLLMRWTIVKLLRGIPRK